jgi:DNA primase
VYDFGKDPDEAVKNDPIAFKKLIKKPTPIYDFIIDKAVKKYSQGDVFSKKEVAAEVIPLISSIQNPIVKSHYFKKLGTILEVDPDSVLSLATKYVKTQDSKQNKQFINKQKPQKNREELVEEYILSYILKQKNPHIVLAQTGNILGEEDFESPPLRKIFASVLTTDGGNFSIYEFTEALDPELKETCDTLFLSDASMYDGFLETDFEKSIYELKKISLKRQIRKNLDLLERDGENDQIAKLTEELTKVEKKLVVM